MNNTGRGHLPRPVLLQKENIIHPIKKRRSEDAVPELPSGGGVYWLENHGTARYGSDIGFGIGKDGE